MTGAQRGIGKAIALAMAREGAKVVVSDLVREGCNQVIEEIRKAGSEGIAR